MPKLGVSELIMSLADLFFPRTCPFCENGQRLDSDALICRQCLDAVREIRQPFCQKCGLPVQAFSDQGPEFCPGCLTDPPPYGRARFGVSYAGPFRDALLRFKFYGGLHLGRVLSGMLVHAFYEHFEPDEFDLIVPMPIHRKRLIQRGFNQAVILAQGVSHPTGIPLDRTTFHKTEDTPPQVGLKKTQRVRNLRRSFGISRPDTFRGRRILLIDDVFTTGSTISEASRAIMEAMPGSLDVLVLAVRLRGQGDSPPARGGGLGT